MVVVTLMDIIAELVLGGHWFRSWYHPLFLENLPFKFVNVLSKIIKWALAMVPGVVTVVWGQIIIVQKK